MRHRRNPAEITQACVVLARGGRLNNEQIINENNIVRAINAMNSYGLYERTGEISLLAAGVRALSCKSRVGGLIINIRPTTRCSGQLFIRQIRPHPPQQPTRSTIRYATFSRRNHQHHC